MGCCKTPLKVLITGAGGQIGYSMVFMVGRGLFFGNDQPVHMVMCDLPQCEDVLKGIRLELEDCAMPLLVKIDVCVSQEDAFKDIDYAILVAGALNLTGNMKRSDLLHANREMYEKQGDLIEKYAKRTVKVLVVANPANTNCLILSERCKSIPKENFSCLTRLDHDRAVGFIARKLGVSCSDVHNSVVWGNHSSSMVPDLSHAHVPTAGIKSVENAINDAQWVEKVFVPEVKERSAAVIAFRKRSSALSASNASSRHTYDWFNGTPSNTFVSMGVYSDGTAYGIPAGIFFGFPVTIKDGKYTIVKDLPVTDKVRAAMMASAEELIEEKNIAFSQDEQQQQKQ